MRTQTSSIRCKTCKGIHTGFPCPLEEYRRMMAERESGEHTIPCITLWRPWADFILLGWKTIETRTHSRFAPLVGKRIAIHAGRKWDRTAAKLAKPYLTGERALPWHFRSTPGVVICTAMVLEQRELSEEHSHAAMIDCGSTRRFGLFLSDIRPVTPFQANGKMGIWRVTIP